MAVCKFLFHVHTKASYDSVMSPLRIVQFCRRHGIDCVAICDHDSMASIEAAVSAGKRMGVTVIPGIEYSTDAGDIIGLFVNTITSSRQVGKVLEHTRAQGGLTVLPHPARGHHLHNIPMDMVDLVETYNSRCSARENKAAEELAVRHRKPTLAGPDAHLPSELGLALNELTLPEASSATLQTPPTLQVPAALRTEDIKQLLLAAPRKFQCNKTHYSNVCLSQIIKGVKHRRPRLVLHNACRLIEQPVRRRLWRFAPQQH